jgi:hypothetical protein
VSSKPLPDCEKGQSLWRDYFHATTSHVSLDRKLRLTVFGPNIERIATLALEVETAELARNTVFDSLRKHKTEPRPRSASADT